MQYLDLCRYSDIFKIQEWSKVYGEGCEDMNNFSTIQFLFHRPLVLGYLIPFIYNQMEEWDMNSIECFMNQLLEIPVNIYIKSGSLCIFFFIHLSSLKKIFWYYYNQWLARMIYFASWLQRFKLKILILFVAVFQSEHLIFLLLFYRELGIDTLSKCENELQEMFKLAQTMFDTKLPPGVTMLQPFSEDSSIKKIAVRVCFRIWVSIQHFFIFKPHIPELACYGMVITFTLSNFVIKQWICFFQKYGGYYVFGIEQYMSSLLHFVPWLCTIDVLFCYRLFPKNFFQYLGQCIY